MCGIVGYVGKQNASQIILEGLKRLEYRGYDSAGIAILKDNAFKIAKHVGRVKDLITNTNASKITGTTGIGHTRWATHGAVTHANTHPHISSCGKIAIIHNGVIENYNSLKKLLNVELKSETDTEVLCNLIAHFYKGNFLQSVTDALSLVEGTYGICVMCIDCPDEIIAARLGSPLIIGASKEGNVIASCVSAIISLTDKVIYLNDNDIVHITPTNISITNNLEKITPIIQTVNWKVEDSDLKQYKHFMQKEIFEQPTSIKDAMRGRFSADNSTCVFGGLNLTEQELRNVDRIHLLGCGSAWHASLVTEQLIEKYAQLPVDVDYAHEFRYRDMPISDNTLFICFSQSGETIDTLLAMKEAQRKRHKVLAIVNVVGSSIARQAHGGIYQHAGPEIGVASTKCFTSQLVIGAMLALYFARLRGMSYELGVQFVNALKQLPTLIEAVLQQHEHIKQIAEKYAHEKNFLFLGRLNLFPIALEGALKLKEVSYIHAEGYPAAEMKHGPIALINEHCPSIVFVNNSIVNKVVSSMQEIKARHGKVIAITNSSTHLPTGLADDVIIVPDCHEALQPILYTIVVQLISYYTSITLNLDCDKPRNLAKSVTVE